MIISIKLVVTYYSTSSAHLPRRSVTTLIFVPRRKAKRKQPQRNMNDKSKTASPIVATDDSLMVSVVVDTQNEGTLQPGALLACISMQLGGILLL